MAPGRRGGPGRSGRRRDRGEGLPRRGDLLLPGALDVLGLGLRGDGAGHGAHGRSRHRPGRSASDRLPGRAAPGGRGALPAHALAHRGRRCAAGGRRPRGGLRGRRGDRLRLGIVRDDPPPHREPAGHAGAQLGAAPDRAHRGAGPAALPGPRPRDPGGHQSPLRDRLARGPDLRGDHVRLRARGRSGPAPGLRPADPRTAPGGLVGRAHHADPAPAGGAAGAVPAARRRDG